MRKNLYFLSILFVTNKTTCTQTHNNLDFQYEGLMQEYKDFCTFKETKTAKINSNNNNINFFFDKNKNIITSLSQAIKETPDTIKTSMKKISVASTWKDFAIDVFERIFFSLSIVIISLYVICCGFFETSAEVFPSIFEKVVDQYLTGYFYLCNVDGKEEILKEVPDDMGCDSIVCKTTGSFVYYDLLFMPIWAQIGLLLMCGFVLYNFTYSNYIIISSKNFITAILICCGAILLAQISSLFSVIISETYYNEEALGGFTPTCNYNGVNNDSSTKELNNEMMEYFVNVATQNASLVLDSNAMIMFSYASRIPSLLDSIMGLCCLVSSFLGITACIFYSRILKQRKKIEKSLMELVSQNREVLELFFNIKCIQLIKEKKETN